MLKKFLNKEGYNSLAIFILRVMSGGMMLVHGWGKLIHFSEKASQFPDPIGLGPSTSMALAIFAEFFCSIAVALGLLTRLALIPQIITMAVAALIFHANDPWSQKEQAFMYLTVFVVLFLTGPGKFSMDHHLLKK